MKRIDVEAALDAGRIEVLMNSGRWWRIRRNGKTRTWKTRPFDYEIPFKMGLCGYGTFTASDGLALDDPKVSGYFRLVQEETNVQK